MINVKKIETNVMRMRTAQTEQREFEFELQSSKKEVKYCHGKSKGRVPGEVGKFILRRPATVHLVSRIQRSTNWKVRQRVYV